MRSCAFPKNKEPYFVACMEDVLEVYNRPYDKAYPVLCMDEKPLQLLAEARSGHHRKDGVHTQDSEYVRNGTCNIFLFTEPLSGFRYATAIERRTKIDWAKQMKFVADTFYPDAENIILVCNNLNTHDKNSFYEAFPPLKLCGLPSALSFITLRSTAVGLILQR